MKKILITSVLTISLYANNLNDLIDIALKNNTNIKQSEIKVSTQEQSHIKSESLYLPTLSLEADVSNHDIETSGVTTDGNSQTVSLSASQLLYDFGKSSNKIKSTKQNLKAARKELDSTSATIILNVKSERIEWKIIDLNIYIVTTV